VYGATSVESGSAALLNRRARASTLEKAYLDNLPWIVSVGTERNVIRYLAWLCAWTGAVISLGSCHYSAEDSWADCCGLHIIRDETSSPAARRIIIDWQQLTWFGGNGSAVDANNTNLPGSWKKRQITQAVTEFLAGNPGARASDYFLSLGMTCRPGTTVPNDGVTRCEDELPIWIICRSRNVFFPGGPPVPEELRKPMSALLHVSVDVSVSALLAASTRVVAVPGGRLCHR